MTRTGRIAFGVTAGLSAFGVTLNLITVALGMYQQAPKDPYLLGNNPEGAAGLVSRVVDYFSYFTILSNIVVIIVCTLLALGRARPTPVMRALRMDSLMMISVTGLVFALVLAPSFHPDGLEYVTNPLHHYVTPILAVATWLVWGPRGWLRLSSVFTALVIPVIWLAYTFLRGAVIHAFPYGFLAVDELGWGRALVNVAGVLVVGIVLGLAFWGLDVLLSRGTVRDAS
jgi:hypothetical protein